MAALSEGVMHIACAANSAYVPHCATMIHSVLTAHDPGLVTVHLLRAPDVDEPTVGELEAMTTDLGGRLVVHADLEHEVSDLPVMDRIPAVMWYRVFLPQLLPMLDRVLYLDCDTLVVDDLSELWDLDLEGRYLGAVNNAFEPGMERHATDLGLRSAADYFNSGVLLLNLERMRADGVTGAILECARTRPLIWPDQDALNLVLGARRLPLDPRWNCMNVLFYGSAPTAFSAGVARAAAARPAILHFEGPQMAKPWHYLNRHPRRSEYFAHRGATPWPEIDIEGRTLANRTLRPLPTRAVNRILRLEQQARRRLRRS
jgi:lipopolysaccharide biosynthesis glycosyltransferase